MNLNALAIGLGLESTEYEAEQFPGLIYRPSGADSVVLLFTSGRVVITGSPDLDTTEETSAALQEEVTDLLAVDYPADQETSTRRSSTTKRKQMD